MSGFVAAGSTLVSNVTHVVINTEIVGPDERKGRCVAMLSALALITRRSRRTDVLNELMCPLKPDKGII